MVFRQRPWGCLMFSQFSLTTSSPSLEHIFANPRRSEQLLGEQLDFCIFLWAAEEEVGSVSCLFSRLVVRFSWLWPLIRGGCLIFWFRVSGVCSWFWHAQSTLEVKRLHLHIKTDFWQIWLQNQTPKPFFTRFWVSFLTTFHIFGLLWIFLYQGCVGFTFYDHVFGDPNVAQCCFLRRATRWQPNFRRATCHLARGVQTRSGCYCQARVWQMKMWNLRFSKHLIKWTTWQQDQSIQSFSILLSISYSGWLGDRWWRQLYLWGSATRMLYDSRQRGALLVSHDFAKLWQSATWLNGWKHNTCQCTSPFRSYLWIHNMFSYSVSGSIYIFHEVQAALLVETIGRVSMEVGYCWNDFFFLQMVRIDGGKECKIWNFVPLDRPLGT